ncbi:MAG: arginine--tRNA ligase [Thermoplasmata archaeon]|nr:arginine--tRNA ligase [Thermoplasmata archaeon]
MLAPPVPTPEEVDPWEVPVAAVVASLLNLLPAHGIAIDESALRKELEMGQEPPARIALPLHRLARTAGKDPAGLATVLARASADVGHGLTASSMGPYLNFGLAPWVLAETTLRLLHARGDRYGKLRAVPTTVCVEHTSANPNGPFHIGRVRNAIIGDTYARILRAAGHPVTVHYYVDDVGRQAAVLTWIWSKPLATWPSAVRATLPEGSDGPPAGEKPDRYYGRPYPAVSALLKDNSALASELEEYSRALEQGRPPARHRELARAVLDGMLASLLRLGIRYDEFVWESSLLTDGSVESVVRRLREAPHAVVEPNGAGAIDAAGYGLPQESSRIIFTRGDGSTLYVTRDLAYHLAKFERFARVVDVLGADHLLHAGVLEALLAEIGESRRPEFVFYQYIQAPGGAKMSTRAGTAVYLDDLLAESVTRARAEVLARREDLAEGEIDAIAEAVGAAAVRYSIVRVAPDKPVKFRWEEALSFEGRSAPFLQYSYARATSLLRKAERLSGPYPFRATELGTPEEEALVQVLSRLPERVGYAARSGHVHAVATYAHELADAFHRCYQAVPVLRAGPERESRLSLVAATRIALGNTLDLLGLARPERM